jgi:hypothetical protein
MQACTQRHRQHIDKLAKHLLENLAVGQKLFLREKNERKGAQQVMKFITAKLVPSEMSKSKTMGKKAKTKGRQ